MNALDQIFVTLKHAIVGWMPAPAQPLGSILLSLAGIMAVFYTCFAVTTLVERKLLGRIQNRRGPCRVGPFGLLQPAADGIKMITKEDIVPANADKLIHYLAPIVLASPVWLTLAVLPLGRNMSAIDLDAGVLFFFAVGASSELAVFMAGWSSANKYSLVGAMRAMAQMISYEVPLVLSTVPVLMIAGSLSLNEIVQAQGASSLGWLEGWNIFRPWGLAGFVLFLVAATAESNRSPFDLPEAESEIIAGYLTEYSGFKYALFFLGEYLGLFALSGLGVTLFLGGWHAPIAALEEVVPSWLWFAAKFGSLIFAFIWIRGTVPRLRLDQLLTLAWRFLVPMTLVNILVAAVWHFSGAWQFAGALGIRWLAGAVMIGIPYAVIGRALTSHLTPQRNYTYAG